MSPSTSLLQLPPLCAEWRAIWLFHTGGGLETSSKLRNSIVHYSVVIGLRFNVKIIFISSRLRLLLNRLSQEDYISDQLTMDKRVPVLAGEELFPDTNSVPCFCHSRRFKSRDLGPQYYPRYLSEKTCDNSLCGSDSIYCCNPSYHEVLFLKNEASTDTKDGRLPGFMRAQWKFEEVNVTVSCVCETKSLRG